MTAHVAEIIIPFSPLFIGEVNVTFDRLFAVEDFS